MIGGFSVEYSALKRIPIGIREDLEISGTRLYVRLSAHNLYVNGFSVDNESGMGHLLNHLIP